MSQPPARLRAISAGDTLTLTLPHRFPDWVVQGPLTVAFLGSALVLVVWDDPVARAALMVSIVGAGWALARNERPDGRGTHTLTLDADGLTVAGIVEGSATWLELSHCEVREAQPNHTLVLHLLDEQTVEIPVAPEFSEELAWVATRLAARIRQADSPRPEDTN